MTTNENSISQIKQDIDCIVECMSKLVQMTKTSIQISSDSNNKIEILKKTLSDTGKYLEDSNLYIKHLENRIVSLENKQVTETVSHNSGENNGSVTVTEEGTSANSDLLPQPLQQLTSTSNNPDTEWEIFYFNDFFSPTDEQEHTHESGNSHTATEADPDTDPSTSAALPSTPTTTSAPSINNLQEQIMKIKYQQETETCQKSVLFSNFPAGLIESLKKRKESFWPLLRSKLRPYELDNILIDATKVKIMGNNALKIEYKDHYRANYRIQQMRRHVGFLRKEISNWGEDNIRIKAAINLRFSKITPAKLNKKRRTLEKLGKYLKKLKKIHFFDLVVVRDDIYLRTCWSHYEVDERNLTTTKKRAFTYYDALLGSRILAGEVSIEERDARLQRSRYTLPGSGITIYHARSPDIDIYGEVPAADTGRDAEP